jgi:hypothetical protein
MLERRYQGELVILNVSLYASNIKIHNYIYMLTVIVLQPATLYLEERSVGINLGLWHCRRSGGSSGQRIYY